MVNRVAFITVFVVLGGLGVAHAQVRSPSIGIADIEGAENVGGRYFKNALVEQFKARSYSIASPGSDATDVRVLSEIFLVKKDTYEWKVRLLNAESGEFLGGARWQYKLAPDLTKGFEDNSLQAATAIAKKFDPIIRQLVASKPPPAPPEPEPEPVAEPPPVPAAPEPKPKPEPKPLPASVDQKSPLMEKMSNEEVPKAQVEETKPAKIAPVPKATEISIDDKSVVEATRYLADVITREFKSRHSSSSFHRVAVPYFSEFGSSVSEKHLGKVVAELISSELAERTPFVIVERERLDQVMKEHRLVDLGLLDEGSAASLGNVMGAQSLISGSVSEAGSNFLVTLRQVDVKSGKVLVSGKASIDRDDLVALSEKSVVLRSRSGALFRSVLIPGWGQFYNDQPVKGTAFLLAGLGTLGSAIGYAYSGTSAQSRYGENTADTVGFRDTANQHYEIANWVFAAYGVTWLFNVADAYLSGRDATEINLNSP